MEMNGHGQRETWNTSSSSDLNHSSSSNSISLSHSNSNSNSISNQTRHNHNHNHHHQQQQEQEQQRRQESDPMQSWWESVSKARSRIQSLLSLLPDLSDDSLSSLVDSDRPGRSLLESHAAYTAVASALTGSGDDPLCQWLYDTFQESESDLRLVVMSYVPLIAGMYLTRIHAVSTTTPSPVSPSLAGFEAVLLALYSSVTKSRSGKPVLVSIPTPAYLAHHSSLYHHHNPNLTPNTPPSIPSNSGIGVGVLCPPLEPQVGIKSTKRPFIIGLAFHSFYSHISQMPSWSKIQLCSFAASWAGDHCPCDLSLDVDNDDPDDLDLAVSDSDSPLQVSNEVAVVAVNAGGGLIPLPWEVLQPMLRILAHCLLAPPPLVSDDIREAASEAVRRLYARASHDLSPQAILATRSLVLLHTRATAAATAAALAAAAATSTATTPTSHKKAPEMLLVSQ